MFLKIAEVKALLRLMFIVKSQDAEKNENQLLIFSLYLCSFFLQLPEFDCDPVDNCLSSVLGQEVELTDEFKRNYEKWLHNEVCTA